MKQKTGFTQHHFGYCKPSGFYRKLTLGWVQNGAGFTIIEILVVIGILAIIATVVLIAINPVRQFAQARNSQRLTNVTAILNAIGQNIADNKGIFTCPAGVVPTSATAMKSSGGYHIAPCIVPTYMSALPFDPSAAGAYYTSNSDYDTGYTVLRDATAGRITVSAPAAELGVPVISITR